MGVLKVTQCPLSSDCIILHSQVVIQVWLYN